MKKEWKNERIFAEIISDNNGERQGDLRRVYADMQCCAMLYAFCTLQSLECLVCVDIQTLLPFCF